jgi:hypothetical protein
MATRDAHAAQSRSRVMIVTGKESDSGKSGPSVMTPSSTNGALDHPRPQKAIQW